MGRPSTFTQEIADSICDELADGKKSLRTICTELGISHTTVLNWASDKPEFADQYARAREMGDDAQFEDLVDDASEPPRTVKGFTDAGWVTWKKNQLDIKKWSLSKRRPKKYGDKLDLNVAGSLNVTNLTEEELAAKLSGFGIVNAPPEN